MVGTNGFVNTVIGTGDVATVGSVAYLDNRLSSNTDYFITIRGIFSPADVLVGDGRGIVM